MNEKAKEELLCSFFNNSTNTIGGLGLIHAKEAVKELEEYLDEVGLEIKEIK